jgi:hypothetical protein
VRHCSTFTGSNSWLSSAARVVVERIDLAGDAERAVAHVPAGAAGDLAELAGIEIAVLEAVELAVWAKATWSTSRLRPMPIASVATI